MPLPRMVRPSDTFIPATTNNTVRANPMRYGYRVDAETVRKGLDDTPESICWQRYKTVRVPCDCAPQKLQWIELWDRSGQAHETHVVTVPDDEVPTTIIAPGIKG